MQNKQVAKKNNDEVLKFPELLPEVNPVAQKTIMGKKSQI